MTEPDAQHWSDDVCPICGHELADEPPDSCSSPRFRLLHWLKYLSEDRICAGWHTDCQAMVLGWCERRRVPDKDPWEWPDFMSVTESEAKTVLELVEQAGGEWRWDDRDNGEPDDFIRFHPRAA